MVGKTIMKTALYRIWGNEGELLYVGISKSALSRLGQHLSEKPWADQISNVTIETYPTREQAAAAEVAAIKAEKPLHNVVHNGKDRANKFIKTEIFPSFSYSLTRGGWCEVKAGDHVALALDDGKCPIGRIVSILRQDQGCVLELQLKSWVTGFYDSYLVSIPASKVNACEIANVFNGYVDDEHLGEMQTYWKNCHENKDPRIVNPLPYWVIP